MVKEPLCTHDEDRQHAMMLLEDCQIPGEAATWQSCVNSELALSLADFPQQRLAVTAAYKESSSSACGLAYSALALEAP